MLTRTLAARSRTPSEAPNGSAVLELGGAAKLDAVTVNVRPMKVELRIGKASPGKWDTPKCHYSNTPGTALPPTTTKPAAASAPATKPPPPAAATLSPSARPPAYPTSSRSGPKNWDNIADKDEEEEGKSDPDAFQAAVCRGDGGAEAGHDEELHGEQWDDAEYGLGGCWGEEGRDEAARRGWRPRSGSEGGIQVGIGWFFRMRTRGLVNRWFSRFGREKERRGS